MSFPPEEQIGEIPLELKPDVDPELVEEFISEAREQLEHIEQGALALEKNRQDAEGIHTLFRAFHSLKGNAGFLDLATISSLAHLLESLLDEARENRLQITTVIVELILTSRDTLQRFVDEIEAQITGKKPRRCVDIPTAALKATIQFMLKGGALPPKPSDTLTDEEASRAANLLLGEREAPEKRTTSSRYVTGTALHAVKVDTAKLDSLVDLTGELLIAQSVLGQSVLAPEVSRHTVTRQLDQLARISKELQRTAMAMRMVPIRATLQKMQRLARDLSAKQHKSVQLVLEGEETEVDRTLVEKLSDPLLHMIANAVDHGIELPDQRVARGKPSTGTISLRAYHQSGSIVIEVADDGLGLHRERIREKALKTGLLKPGATPDDKELLGLILQPGFSTAAAVTKISGRGVGLDVVQKNVAKLRGKIEVRSVAGQGTTFTLRLPLTLAVIDGLIIGVGGQRYIIPATSVRESFDARSCAVTVLPGEREVAAIRRELIPLLRLRDHFQIADLVPGTGDGILIVIESDGQKRCLLADELLGKQEVVIKNLGEVFRTDPMVSGGAILGNGQVGLILDPGALVHLSTPVAHQLFAA